MGEIVGCTGNASAVKLIKAGLEGLQYHGYDSAGVLFSGGGKGVQVFKQEAPGRVDHLFGKIPAGLEATLGLGHLRWASHGCPNEQNCHLQSDASGKIWLVHSGVLENYSGLRDGLKMGGSAFRSETDTEAIALAIGRCAEKGTPFIDAFCGVMRTIVVGDLKAVVAWSESAPDMLVAATRGVRLGVASHEGFSVVTTDESALPEADFRWLQQGEVAILYPASCKIVSWE